jgi:MoaA/NifB/PqqE/SkfB family radical SAM enzyme
MRRALGLIGAMIANRRGEVPRPSFCTYLVTYRCNARCGMCDSWRMKPGRELTVDQIGTVFARLGRLDAVRLTGGEPFLRDDLAEIARTVARASDPLLLHVTTNGSRTEPALELARRYPRPERLRFLVSFDGLEEEHDRNRGAEVTFARALETVAALCQLGVRVAANHTVMSRASLADAEGLRARLQPLGVEVQTVLAYAESSMYSVRLRGKRAEHAIVPDGYPLHPSLARAEAIELVDRELDRLGETHDLPTRIAKRYYLRGLRSRLARERPSSPRPRCVALRSHVRLLPNGSVPVCQFNTETVGNLFEHPLEEVWRDGPATRARAWVDACPGCWAECEVTPNAFYTGDLLRALT